MQPQRLQPNRFVRAFWVGLGVTIALTLGLAGIIIWLMLTQNLAQLSVLIGLIASIVAIISAPLIFYFTVFKKPEKQEALLLGQENGIETPQFHPPKPIFSSQTIFASIASDPENEYWGEWDEHDDIFDIFYRNPDIFGDREYFKCFRPTKAVANADPSFDITLMNTTTEPMILTDIGIEIVCIAEVGYLGGEAPVSVKVKVSDAYIIDIPSLLDIPSVLTKIKEVEDNEGSSLWPIDVNERVSIHIPDPIYLQAKAPYRYRLFLRNYYKHLPNYAIIRMWLQTNQGQERSKEILIFTL